MFESQNKQTNKQKNPKTNTKKVQKLQEKVSRKCNCVCLCVGKTSETILTPLQIKSCMENRKKDQGQANDKEPNTEAHVKLNCPGLSLYTYCATTWPAS